MAYFGLMALPLGEGKNAPPSNEDIARVIVGGLESLEQAVLDVAGVPPEPFRKTVRRYVAATGFGRRTNAFAVDGYPQPHRGSVDLGAQARCVRAKTGMCRS